MQHGINSKLDFGEGSGTQQTTSNGQGHRTYIQTAYGATQCNPQTQNCDTSTSSSLNNNYGFSSTQNCNPQTQNCGQGLGTGYQIHGSSVPTCDPRFQNCERSSSGGYNAFGQSQGQFVPGCNPSVQNCGQGYGNTQQQAYGHSVPSSSSHTLGTNYGSSQQIPSHGSGQHNYHKVCNINDTDCQSNGTSLKKSKEPKCPEDFQGITKHPTDCKKFLNCANGLTFIQDCAPGTLFNPTIGNCDFPYNVDCSSNETDEIVTEHYEENTVISDWEKKYLENAQTYGQNAGHGEYKIQ